MKRKILIIFAILLTSIFLISGCSKETSYKFCFKDSGCVVSGCNGELCVNRPMPSVCLWKPEYACLKYSSCRCINFQCQWENTSMYRECLDNVSKGIKSNAIS